jgi:Short-chain dehydrogenases of various substrate specificities
LPPRISPLPVELTQGFAFFRAGGYRMPRKVFSSQAYRHKVVLVSGGCSGIGRALALRFARAGARLAILDLDQAALDSLVQHLRDHLGGEALGLRCDVADADAVERAVALAVERFGGIDVLVNNAGITHRGTFAETGLGVFRKVMAVNFFGAVHCTRAALPSLLERRGQIVVLSSLTGFAPLLYRSAYNASKHALHGLFDTLRMELEGTGVSVTLACPGFTATDLRKNALVGDGSVTRQPVQVLGSQVASPVEVAEAIFQGAARRRRLLVLSNVNWRARLLARFFPRLFEKLLVPRLSGLKPQP